MGKTKLLLGTITSIMLLLSACGTEEKTSGSKEKAESKPKTVETNTDTKGKSLSSVADYIAEDTEGNVDVIYSKKDPKYTHDLDGFKVSVDEYQIM